MTTQTFLGNLVELPELRFTGSGASVASFRIAHTERRYDAQSQQWKDVGETLFLNVSAWRGLADNVVATFYDKEKHVGVPVIVVGKLQMRTYEDREGQKRVAYQVEASHVGPDLNRTTAEVTKVGGASSSAAPAAPAAPAAATPAASAAAAAPASPAAAAAPAAPAAPAPTAPVSPLVAPPAF